MKPRNYTILDHRKGAFSIFSIRGMAFFKKKIHGWDIANYRYEFRMKGFIGLFLKFNKWAANWAMNLP